MLIILLIISQVGISQLDGYDITYPYKGPSDRIAFDKNGYLWIVDGHDNTTTFYKYDGKRLIESHKLDSEKDNFKGNLIFISDKILISKYNTLLLYNPSTSSSDALWSLPVDDIFVHSYQDELNHIWIFAENKSDNTKSVYISVDGQNFKYAFDRTGLLPSEDVMSLRIQDKGGLLYFCGFEDGLTIIDRSGQVYDLDGNPASQTVEDDCHIYRLDNKNELWQIKDRLIKKYNPESKKFVLHPISGKIKIKEQCNGQLIKNGFKLINVTIDQSGGIWMSGEDSHIYKYEEWNDQLIYFGREIVNNLGAQGGFVSSTLIDKDGNLYGRQWGGVFKFHENENYFHKMATDMADKDHPLYATADPTIIDIIDHYGELGITNAEIGYNPAVIDNDIYYVDRRFVFKSNTVTSTTEIIPVSAAGSNIRIHKVRGQIIVSKWDAHYLLDEESGQLHKFEQQFKRLENIIEMPNGDVWASGYLLEGYKPFLYKSDPDKLYFNIVQDSLYENADLLKTYVSSMTSDDQNNLWISTISGIYAIKNSGKRIEKLEIEVDSFPSNILIDNKSVIQIIDNQRLGFIIGSGFGIINLKEKRVEKYIPISALGYKKINSRPLFKDNTVWFGVNQSLAYYNFDTKQTLLFSEEQGLDPGERIVSISQINDNDIALSTHNGMYIYKPDSLLSIYKSKTDQAPKIPMRLEVFSYLDGDNNSTLTTKYLLDQNIKPIELDYNDKVIKFQFSLTHHEFPDRHKYSYFLDGYSHKWSEPISQNYIEFSSLPPGDYTLKIKGDIGYGIWSKNEIAIPLHVNVAWYKSWWFFVLCLLAISGLIAYFYKSKYEIQKAKSLREQETKELGRMKEMDQFKNNFYTNITHEFRTPLTVIMGMTNNIAAHEEEKKLINRNTKNLLMLINQMLDISKAEAGYIKVNKTTDDIVKYIQYLSESFYSLAVDYHIRFSFYTEVESLVMSYDELKIQQIVYNLISNAIKFTEEGGKVMLHMKTTEVDGNSYVQVQVIDTGIGIPDSDIPHIFDRFYQFKDSVTKFGRGTGVGLSLCKILIDLMGGIIEVKSKEKVGTTFTIAFPIENKKSETIATKTQVKEISKIEEAVLSQEMLQENEDTVIVEKPVLLLVEDNRDVATYILDLLRKDYTVHLATNGAIGIDMAYQLVPDIVISDIMMPLKNGYELCQTLKNDEKTSHIPIILLTAKVAQSDKVEGLNYGADAFLNKPFHKEELFIRLKQLIITRKRVQEYYGQSKNYTENSLEEVIPNHDNSFLKRLNAVVIENMADSNFGVNELKVNNSMNAIQIYRKLKALTGKTPSLFIRGLRLQKAEELLSTTHMSVSEVAYAVGFKDPSYFSRVFLKEYKTSPRDYRK